VRTVTRFQPLALPLAALLAGVAFGGSAPRLLPQPAAAAEPRVAGAGLLAAIPPSRAFFRPVVVEGQAFPVARSNFLSLLEFPDNWLAPRLRLIDGQWRLVGVHLGIDISAESGTPVVAMQSGVVENAGWTFYSGTRLGVRGDDRRYYLYAHLSRIADGISEGSPVRVGEVLGLIGNTGYGPPGHRDQFPPHLHLGIQAGGEWVNPYPALVSLYGAAVRRTDRRQAALDSLAAEGDRQAWERAAGRLYMSLDTVGGE
jgi:murein DD-endopeptidase MepM/ murein hydrolase activator NlpD